jgi:Domain of unknown function (DUF4268)/TIR domain
MKVFLSWSGDESRKVAEALYEWLPSVLPSVEPWISSEDISKGRRWARAIDEQLQETSFCVVCVVPGNAAAPWINFEAGAISKIVSDAHVVPLLFDVEPKELMGLPLGMFQAATFEKEDMYRVLRTINAATGIPLSSERLKKNLDLCWNGLVSEIHGASNISEGRGTLTSYSKSEHQASRQRVHEAPGSPSSPPAEVRGRPSAERHRLRHRFWQGLLDVAKEKGLRLHANRTPTTSHWLSAGAGISGYSWNYVIWMDDAGAVELDIDTGDKRKNKRLFDALRSRKAEIEAAFGAPLEWQRLDDARRSGIRYIVREGGLTTPEDKWPKIQAAMVEAMARLTKILQPHLQSRAGASLKYLPLGDYLAARQDEALVRLSFTDIEKIISGSLPPSAHQYREWWSNQSDTSNRPQAAAWLNAGFKVGRVDQESGWVEFVRKQGLE